MGLKDKIKIEDLLFINQFLHQIYKKVNVSFVTKHLLIFIVLTVVIIILSGYVLTIWKQHTSEAHS
jgi:hypothetical protein